MASIPSVVLCYFPGVVCAMEGALDFLDLGTLAGKRVAIQGAGHVGKTRFKRSGNSKFRLNCC